MLQEIFRTGNEGSSTIYWWSKKEMAVSRNTSHACDSEIFEKKTLHEDNGVWLLTEESVTDCEVGRSAPNPKTCVAGQSRDEALEFLIDRLVAPYKNRKPTSFDDCMLIINSEELEANLRQYLLQ